MSEIQKEHPNIQVKNGDLKKQPEVGDIVKLSDGTVCIVTEMSPDKTSYKGTVLREKNDRYELEGLKTVTFNRNKIAAVQKNEDLHLQIEQAKRSVSTKGSLSSELRDSHEIYSTSKVLYGEESTKKEKDLHDKRKEDKHTHNMSVSVITNGDVDGYIKGGNSHETIISGETADGVLFSAYSVGENISRSTIESRVNDRVESADLTHEKADESAALSEINEALSNPHSSDVIEVSGGVVVNKSDFGLEDDAQDKTEIDFESGSDDHSGADPADHSLSLDEILEQTGGIADDSPLNGVSYSEPEIDDDFEPELTLI